MQVGDAELVASLKKREADAVGIMLEQYSDRLYNYLYYHSGDHHLAEDIVSDTFMRVIEKIDSFELREVPFKAWLFRIAHNLLVDNFRRRNKFKQVSLQDVDWDTDPAVSGGSDWGAADGGDLAEQLGQREELTAAITRLPEEQRNIFILRFVEGFELEAVARMLDKSVSAVKSLQFRAVQNLRRHLSENAEYGRAG
jgi:RNA polymerase sigma-70 factor (ECF subfamily)